MFSCQFDPGIYVLVSKVFNKTFLYLFIDSITNNFNQYLVQRYFLLLRMNEYIPNPILKTSMIIYMEIVDFFSFFSFCMQSSTWCCMIQ